MWLSLYQMFQQTDYLKERKMEDFEEKDMAEDDVTDSSSYKSAPSHLSPETQGSIASGNEIHIPYTLDKSVCKMTKCQYTP